MTNSEFSNEFDVLYNNITSNQAPGLDEYEKSVFLTKALDEILKAYFNPKGNKFLEGFDDNARRLIDFSMLITTKSDFTFSTAKFDVRANSKSTTLPSDIMMVINELLLVTRNSSSVLLLVIPINYLDYTRMMSKPFKRPTHYQAWRLSNSSSSNNVADLIVGPTDNITKYILRYIRRPKAIILTTLEGVTLDNQTAELSCELDPILHLEILQRAVELAKAAYIGNVEAGSNLASMVSLGSNSATNMGIVSSGGSRE